jgi:hypothetical protein
MSSIIGAGSGDRMSCAIVVQADFPVEPGPVGV